MANDNLIGKTINGYEVTGVVGQGGMASVYKAHQISMNRTVALKVLPRQFVDDDTYIARFKREVEIVSLLEHRSIVPVYDYGEVDRQPFIVMRYMPSGSLDKLLAQGPMHIERIIEVIRQIAPALDYAHTNNVLHRDLKPSNVLLDDGDGAYLTDFGIARILGEVGSSTLTTQGVVGTPAYMSPEQAQGKPLDGRSDVYSLGVMLFEMATGRRPFESETPYGVAVMHVTTPPPPPRHYNPALPPRIEAVIYQVLDKTPDNRYQTAVALADALDDAWNQPANTKGTDRHEASYQQPPAVQLYTPQPAVHANPVSPYVRPPNAPPASARQSAWMPPVQARPRRRRQSGNIWVSLLIGVTIGCALLAGLVGAGVYLLSNNLDDLFGEAITTLSPNDEAITPGNIQIVGTSATRTPQQDAPTATQTSTDDTPPTATATQFIPTSGPPPTATVAPIGVRPDGEADAAPDDEMLVRTQTQ